MSLIPLIKYDEKTPPIGSDLKSAITGCNVCFNGTALTKLLVLLSKKTLIIPLIIHNTTHDKKKTNNR